MIGDLLKFDADREHVNHQVHGENHEKKWAEVIKHLRKEVPPKARVWRQVGKCQSIIMFSQNAMR